MRMTFSVHTSVPIVDEWCCGYVKGIALDPVGWQPLIDARPEWFEVIHLYGTKSGRDQLKELVGAHHILLRDIRPLLTELRLPLATSMPTGSPAVSHRRDCSRSVRRLLLAVMIHAHDPARSSRVATGCPTSCTKMWLPKICYCPLSQVFWVVLIF